jgi:hypothetical protein
VLAFSDIIDFLLRLLSDDAARAEFDEDPQGTLEAAGLGGVTAQDIRDARLQLADSGAVSTSDDGAASAGPSHPDGDDPVVREIGYTTRHYVADETGDGAGHADPGPVDRDSTTVTIDDRDTLFFQTISDDDVTITDSFNEDNSSDSLTAIQANGSFNSDDDVTVDAANSFNSDDDLTAVQDNDVAVDVDLDGPGVPPAGGATGPDDLDDAEQPAEPEPAADVEAADAQPADAGTEDPADDAADDAALAG